MYRPHEAELVSHGSLLFLWLILCLSVSLSVCPCIAWAEGGDQSGSGGGNGPAEPMYVQDVSPADGATGVDCNATLWVRYSHNVADMETLVDGTPLGEYNMQFIRLKEQGAGYVDANVYVSDEFAYRQYIYIQPVEELKPGTTYLIIAGAGVQARNMSQQHITQDDQIFSFTTIETTGDDKKPAEETSATQPAPDTTQQEAQAAPAVIGGGSGGDGGDSSGGSSDESQEADTSSVSIEPTDTAAVNKATYRVYELTETDGTGGDTTINGNVDAPMWPYFTVLGILLAIGVTIQEGSYRKHVI